MGPFRLVHKEARRRALQAVAEAPAGYGVTVKEATRSTDQNAALWPRLLAFSDQLQWPVNGAMERLSSEEWKDILTAGFKQETIRMAHGINGGMVVLGHRTSTMGKRAFSDFLEFIHATAVEYGVDLQDVENAVEE